VLPAPPRLSSIEIIGLDDKIFVDNEETVEIGTEDNDHFVYAKSDYLGGYEGDELI
jgi:hypothetical protein